MKEKKTSLKKLLRPNFVQLSEHCLQQFDNDLNIKKVRNCLEKQSSQINWLSFRKEILSQLENLLDIPLYSVLTRSWDSYEKVKKIASAQLHSGLDTVSVVPLRSHKIRSHQQPQMTLNIENCEKIVLPISISLDLSFSNVVVKLQHGEIKRVLSGLCKGSGVVKYGDILLAERDIMEFHLSEEISKEKITEPA